MAQSLPSCVNNDNDIGPEIKLSEEEYTNHVVRLLLFMSGDPSFMVFLPIV